METIKKKNKPSHKPVQMHFYAETETAQAARQMAATQGKNLSQIIREAIREKHERQSQMF